MLGIVLAVIGAYAPELFEEGDQAELLEEIRQLSEGAPAIRTEKRNLRTKSGSTLTVSTLSILIRDWDGDPNHILIVLEATPTA